MPNTDAARGLDMSDGSFDRTLLDLLGRCPRCHRTAHAFNHTGDPVNAEDGPHGVCVECRVYWRLPVTRWLQPETFELAAAQEMTRRIAAQYEQVAPPPLFSHVFAEWNGGAPPSPGLVELVMAEEERGRALDASVQA
jgi:hypothetical protein